MENLLKNYSPRWGLLNSIPKINSEELEGQGPLGRASKIRLRKVAGGILAQVNGVKEEEDMVVLKGYQVVR